jgi:hypothetical protein
VSWRSCLNTSAARLSPFVALGLVRYKGGIFCTCPLIPLTKEVMNALMRRKPGTTHLLISPRGVIAL